MRRSWLGFTIGVGVLVAIASWMAGWGSSSQAPPVSVQHLHAAQLSRATHAFCNCLTARAPLDQCLASAETGDGIGVTDQELLLATCLDRR